MVTVCPGPPEAGAIAVTTGPPGTAGDGAVVDVVGGGAVVLLVDVDEIAGRTAAIGVRCAFGAGRPEEPPFAAIKPISAAAMSSIAVSSQRV